MVERCRICGHICLDPTEMALHLGDDHSSWDLADYAYDCCVQSGRLIKKSKLTMRKEARRRR